MILAKALTVQQESKSVEKARTRLREFDGADFLSDENHLEIFLLQTFLGIENIEKFIKEDLEKMVYSLSVFSDFCKKTFKKILEKVQEFLFSE
jgi:hypothetical protein